MSDRRAAWEATRQARRKPLAGAPLTETQRATAAWEEEETAARSETLTPHPSDTLETKAAKRRQSYATGEVTFQFPNCSICGRRLTYYGPVGVDHKDARCSRCTPPPPPPPTGGGEGNQ